MPAPSSCRTTLLNIPKKYLTVSAYTGKTRIVGSNRHIENAVAMRFVSLDWFGGFYRDC